MEKTDTIYLTPYYAISTGSDAVMTLHFIGATASIENASSSGLLGRKLKFCANCWSIGGYLYQTLTGRHEIRQRPCNGWLFGWGFLYIKLLKCDWAKWAFSGTNASSEIFGLASMK